MASASFLGHLGIPLEKATSFDVEDFGDGIISFYLPEASFFRSFLVRWLTTRPPVAQIAADSRAVDHRLLAVTVDPLCFETLTDPHGPTKGTCWEPCQRSAFMPVRATARTTLSASRPPVATVNLP